MRNLYSACTILAAVLAIGTGASTRGAPPVPSVKRRSRPALVIDEAKLREIAEHNAAVDRRKAEKQARKAARMSDGLTQK